MFLITGLSARGDFDVGFVYISNLSICTVWLLHRVLVQGVQGRSIVDPEGELFQKTCQEGRRSQYPEERSPLWPKGCVWVSRKVRSQWKKSMDLTMYCSWLALPCFILLWVTNKKFAINQMFRLYIYLCVPPALHEKIHPWFHINLMKAWYITKNLKTSPEMVHIPLLSV